MKQYYLILVIFVLISCHKKPESKLNSDIQKQITIEELNTSDLNQENTGLIIFGQLQNERKASYDIGGLVYEIKLSNGISVHKWPSSESITIDNLRSNTVIEITGVSGNKELIDGREEYWIGITWGENTFGPQKYGWVLSSKLNLHSIFFTDLQISGTNRNEQGKLVLNAKYAVNDNVQEFSILPNKQENGNSYTFFWDYRNENFHYSSRPGLYEWNEDTKELKHLSYIISDGFLDWQHIVTSGFRYLIKYKERENWVGEICIWNLKNGEIKLAGRINDTLKLNGHIVEIAKYYDVMYADGWLNHEGDDDWVYGNHLTDKEKDFAKEYLEKNSVPEKHLAHIRENPGIGVVMFFILVEYNIETNEEKIVGGVYLSGRI
jgi:hypothetical protein